EAAIAAGVSRDRIVVDPGLGFGKTVEQNLELIRRTGKIAALGFPVLSGLSRKSFVGRVSLGRDSTPEERLHGTLALSAAHVFSGAAILGEHDVPEHVQLMGALEGLSEGRGGAGMGRDWAAYLWDSGPSREPLR